MNGTPSFAQQRLIALALLLGVTSYAIVAAVLLQQNGGKGMAPEAIELLETIVIAVGAGVGVTAFVMRAVMSRAAERAAPEQRAMLRFQAMLVPLAAVEGACLFALTAWLLNGKTVPSLVVAMVLLALAVAMVPFQDPDADRR